MKVIDTQLGRSGQQVFFRKLIELAGALMLIEITVDSIDYQSKAKISKWSGDTWEPCYSIQPTDMDVDFKLAYAREPLREKALEGITSRLIAVAEQIVAPATTLVKYLAEGCSVDGLSDAERKTLGRNSDVSTARVELANGRSFIAQGPFEMVDGMWKVWTPLEPETFALVQPQQIATIAFSE
ncbi:MULTISPECIES: hypothetical protein [Caballeronia]|uniref:hypothetical protein n=1 Tax=Caballeronia TaxID=1827195 RepID=UPI001FD5FB0E|nr:MULTISPECIES: hypothetical protein [Caballeronia]MDR5799311.1 hypothetical protein [Caballeronia sp. LZ001]